MKPINSIRLTLYTVMAYGIGVYIGLQAVPDSACVKVDDKVWCGPIVKGPSYE